MKRLKNERLVILGMTFISSLCFFLVWWYSSEAYQENLPSVSELERISNELKEIEINVYIFSGENLEFKKKPKLHILEEFIPELSFEDEKKRFSILEMLKERKDIKEKLTIVGNFVVFILKDNKSVVEFGSTRIANILFKDKKDINSLLEIFFQTLIGNEENISEIERWSENYRISFSLINCDFENKILAWDFPNLQNNFLNSFLKDVSDIFDFRIDSQIINSCDFVSFPSKLKNFFVLSEKEIKKILNKNNWKLESLEVNDEYTLHIIFIAVPKDYDPLFIEFSKSKLRNSFIVSKWGGVVLLNSLGNESILLKTENLVEQMEDSISMLRKLIGIHESQLEGVTFDSSTYTSLWEIDKLTMKRLSLLRQKSLKSLIALSKVGTAMKDMMISKEVKKNVDLSLKNFFLSNSSLHFGEILKSFKEVKESCKFAERAFSHPSINNLQYFSLYQKTAVYVPIFIPFLMTGCLLFFKELYKRFQKIYGKKKKEKLKIE